MQLIPVTDKKTIGLFHKLPFTIYRHDPNWTPPLRELTEEVFNPKKNAGIRQGGVRRWIVTDGREPLGRIAAFYEPGYAGSYEQPTGGIGFFECADNQQAANLLFDAARQWLTSEGMEAMDGPINFGENFFNWGLLVDGRKQQTFGMQYHPGYYQQLFLNYGFQTFYEQFSYRMDITSPDLPERFWKIAAWVAQKPDFTFEHFTFKNQEKYIADFIRVHDQAWKKHDNFKPVDPADIRSLLKDSRLLLDEEFIWYVYHQGEPIAFFMMIPDVNQVLKKLGGGKLHLFKLLKLFYYLKSNIISRCRVVVMGVVPKFQRSGIESGIFYQLRQVMLRKPWYNEMELSWVGDFNPKMIALFKAVGAQHEITHHTLRFLFDRTKAFKRAPVIAD